MKFTVPKKELLRAAKIAASNAASKSECAALTTVLVEATDVVTLSGSDLMTGARVVLASSKVEDEGSVMVPARAFLAAVQGLADGEVSVRIDGPRLELKSGRSRQRVAFGNAGDYPNVPQCARAELAQMPAVAMLAALVEVVAAMSPDEARANLHGISLVIVNGTCTAKATNGSVYSIRSIECAGNLNVFIPAKCVPSVRAALEAAKAGDIGVEVHGGYLFLDGAGTTTSAKLSPNDFPNLPIPTKFGHRMVAQRTALLECVRRAATATDADSLAIEISLAPGVVSLKAESKDADALDALDVDYAGPGGVVLVRGSFLSDSLASLTADEVSIEMSGPLDPVVIGDARSRDSVHLIAPTRPK